MQRSSTPGAKSLRSREKDSRAPAPATPPDSATFLVVGIGASAGGLDACRGLIETLPSGNDMAFILVQHLDPTHASMMVDLLSGRTGLKVLQAEDRMRIEGGHFYIIAPGTYLSVSDGALHVSPPDAPHGARLPFDHLLQSMADELGERSVAIVLSGTGSDGSSGLRALKQGGGFVIAQAPEEAAYDGMPRNAIMTGMVDLIAPVAAMAAALSSRAEQMALRSAGPGRIDPADAAATLAEIVGLLRTNTRHDFSLYKSGTLKRRIERRMAMSSIHRTEMRRYLDALRADPAELEMLAKDLLIHVTSFFRDPAVFEALAKTVVSGIVRDQPLDRAIRVWVAGCSTGEEAYSIAMLFREEIAASNRNVKLQVFASDSDSDAVAEAREGLYPLSVTADVSPTRLERFFQREGEVYRVSPDLRACVVFTVQDVLGDPPFSRLDLISCRNLLIYLRPEAQAKVVALFHFALRDGGALLLGGSETTGETPGKFEPIAKAERIFRHLGSGSSNDLIVQARTGSGAPAIRQREASVATRPTALAELCRSLVLDSFAPTAALINMKGECLYLLGSADAYLKVAPGPPAHDLVGMAREDVRPMLRAAIARAKKEGAKVVIADCLINRDGATLSFSIAVQPVREAGVDLFFVCFFDQRQKEPLHVGKGTHESGQKTAALEHELAQARGDLVAVSRSLELAGEEQRAINEEAASAKEEYQATNEEMLASKEELQSLNEELNALNSQLQETLELQRTASNDMRNVLYSTDVATIFLDTKLNIRFFTPATRSLFSVISSDIGRPLADLSSLTSDHLLLSDARVVLQTRTPIEREISARSGAWYVRRILPYRTQNDGIEGVVITFVDVTERRGVAEALQAAKREAQVATVAKSRFLAAASHDLRQPLQTLALLQASLADAVESDKARALVGRLDETLNSVTAMLDTLLDINKIEAGTVRAERSVFPINAILARLHEEFDVHAHAQRLRFKKVPCGAFVESDPGRLEQMLRNLLSNAFKYTRRGGVLLGGRRRGDRLVIQVWDTGVGVPKGELKAIFDEYHQVGNAARERGHGLGLGLSIVQRLGEFLGHPIEVRSRVGKGSVFSIEVPLTPAAHQSAHDDGRGEAARTPDLASNPTGAILLIEDDPELRVLLESLLKAGGHRAVSAVDGLDALAIVARGAVRPDLIITDYNLPGGLNGVQSAERIRKSLHREIPVIVLTGDISTVALLDIERSGATQLTKPVRAKALVETVQTMLPRFSEGAGPDAPPPETAAAAPVFGAGASVAIVDDDRALRAALREVLEAAGLRVDDFETCEAFLSANPSGAHGCLLLDAYLPGMTGLQLLQRLGEQGGRPPTIMITGHSDVSVAVDAMKAGAVDFIEKPVSRDDLLEAIARALAQGKDSNEHAAWKSGAAALIGKLTTRQREVMDLVLAGHPSKNIAADLNISQRTVENHRAEIMKRTGSKSIAALARLAVTATNVASV